MIGEIQPIYKKNVEDAREKYRDAGYQNVRCIGAIITRISPDDFYAMTLQFFGNTMDLDFASEQRLAKENLMHFMNLLIKIGFQKERYQFVTIKINKNCQMIRCLI